MFNVAQIFPSPGIFVMEISAKFIQLKPRKVVLPIAVSQLCSKHTSHSHRRANCSHINLQQKFHILNDLKSQQGKKVLGFRFHLWWPFTGSLLQFSSTVQRAR